MKILTYFYLMVLIGDIWHYAENGFSAGKCRLIIMNTVYFMTIVFIQLIFCNHQYECKERRRVLCFCGLVDKDADVERGLLVDTRCFYQFAWSRLG